MKNEMEIIRLLARLEVSNENRVKISELLNKELDWGYFINEVFSNKISNLIFYNLKKHFFLNSVPIFVYRILKIN